MSSFSDRLREERLRLSMVQPEFADLGGVGKQSQINYESGKRVPDAAYLAALAQHGVDVGFIVTGERSAPPVDRSLLGRRASDYTQVRYWRLSDDAPLEQWGEFSFFSAWLRDLTHSPGECWLFRVVTDCMEPTIPAGAVVLFDHSQKVPRDNALFLLQHDDGLHVRRLRQVGRQWQAECDNRAYPDRTMLDPKARNGIKGQVLWQSSILSRGPK
ncbi:XRE family transcriptional regulator [Paracoccus sp. (in: a-proteobacteria)]|uniref:XRE family transcriptional regulator n=1 Tax=Paracoccus sp. TaxID=267 RepID=UPI0035B19CFB